VPHFIDLDRQFHKLDDTELNDQELLLSFVEGKYWPSTSLKWADVLKSPRVLLLADAGSGNPKQVAFYRHTTILKNTG